MADNTAIEWTDATWNPITGCSVVSPGCTNCYAMKLAGGRLRNVTSRKGLTRDSKAGPVWTGEVRFNEDELLKPLSWKRPRKIFVCAHGDLFHEGVPDNWIDRVFAVMALTPQHTYQVLTKRAARMRAYFSDEGLIGGRAWQVAVEFMGPLVEGPDEDRLFDRQNSALNKLPSLSQRWPLPNVWLGVSAEDQARSDERIPDLLATPAAIRWLSAEPLLGPIDLFSAKGGTLWMGGQRGCDGQHHGIGTPECPRELHHHHDERCGPGLDWVVAGGESGPGARPMHPAWVRSLRDQCADAGVPFLFKQWGSWRPADAHLPLAYEGRGSCAPFIAWPDGTIAHGKADEHGGCGVFLNEVGKKAAGRHLDGVLHDAYPDTRP